MYWIIVSGGVFALFSTLAMPLHAADDQNRIHHFVQEQLSSGKTPNRLIHEKSPYLLQHAFNPVDWYPWGEEALARAKKEDKPVFLSIGYSTCHWCHVMAHESFENPETAAILNKWFISIKVDREERPDIDQIYMAAAQAMTGSGGWPMSVFLLADGSPFYAGTYFPPSSSRQRPGFNDLLTAIHNAWQEKRDKLRESADRLVSALESGNIPDESTIQPDILQRGYNLLAQTYDHERGGFGAAPKFPRPVVFTFLFSHYLSSGRSEAREMALVTLQKMAEGGMHDQIGGGFHRYSVDADWFVPHFEKMLYDQGQLAGSYLDAYLLSKKEVYAQVARDILGYVLRDMRDPEGGFYSAEDADSENPYRPGEHSEGAYYLWSKEEIDKRLDKQEAAYFNYFYGVKDDGNVAADPMGEFTGLNLLHQAHSVEDTAARFKLGRDQMEKSLAESGKVLATARSQRRRPHLDDKIITAWNGMMIGSLARGSRILNDPKLLSAAVEAASFIRATLYNKKNHSLQRRYRDKESGLAGQLDDYSYLTAGLLDLYQASQDPQWLQWAMDLTRKQIELFWNYDSGFFFDSAADPSLKLRMRDIYEGAEPSGNSVAALNLLRLAMLLDIPEWKRMAQRLIESFAEILNRYPPALPLMLTAWEQLETQSSQLVIAGRRGAEDTEAMLRVAEGDYAPSRLLLLADGAENQAYLAVSLPFIEEMRPLDGQATAYLCVDFTCRMPVTDPQALQKQLDEIKKIR